MKLLFVYNAMPGSLPGLWTASIKHYRPRHIRAAYPDIIVDLPAILVERDERTDILVGANDFGDAATVDKLIALIEQRLA